MYVGATPDGTSFNKQCRHLISALNAWAARAEYTTASPIASRFPGQGCMDDVTTERSFDSQGYNVDH